MPRAETLRSRANPLYKRLRALKERAGERELCLLEGPRLVLEALEAGLAVVEAAASERAESSPAGPAALAALRQSGVPVRAMSAELVASLSETETSQGVLALARRPSFPEEGMFEGTPLVLVADGVQDPGNLGGLLRTAEAAGASGAILALGCADAFSWKALRGSMGSAFRVPHLRGVSIEQALDALDARRIPVLATAPDGERRYDEVDLRGPVAVVVGAEGAGLAAAVLERATARLRIPLSGAVESLNVGVAAALVLFEAARQRGFARLGPGE
ncbi:MAG TPA: RNA methyltransferase [Vicinamibacteria bacterium]|nr:RNA methyltransferase [Vicinamibacteria bacterium]